MKNPAYQVARCASLLTAVGTLVAFGFALFAIPVSGANCPGDCISYPYLETAGQYPRDFLWMPLAGISLISFLILLTAIDQTAPENRKIYTSLARTFGTISAAVLLVDYYLQFSVVPMSLINQETEGLALLIQYNPHGIFLILEELGYLLMSVSFGFLIPVFSAENARERALRWIYRTAVVLAAGALLVISIVFGLNRLDRFEVIIISINWLVLISTGFILNRIYKNQVGRNHA
jgi:hypothetical protein